MNQIENNELNKNTDNIEKVEEEESIKVLESSEICGIEYHGRKLTPEDLASDGILPEYKISLDNAIDCYLSKVYEISDDRLAANAFIKDEETNTYKVRSYYRSASQGVWRYLPDYLLNNNGGLGWFGKGFGEESVTLPAELQKYLSQIIEKDENILPKYRDGELIDYTFDFVGTASVRGSDYYSGDVKGTPKLLNGYTYHGQNEKTPPEKIKINYDQSPDFKKVVLTWKQTTSQYGEVNYEVFQSNDGQFKYTFCKNKEGKAWIGGIEDNSKITSIGIHESWIKYEDLTTPLGEYYYENRSGQLFDQTGGYGGNRIGSSVYVDMFEKYLSKIPVIQEYLGDNDASSGKMELSNVPENDKDLFAINSANSFDELYSAIEALEGGGMQGSNGFYSSAKLINIIQRVRIGDLKNENGEPGVKYITGALGLRKKVIELLSLDKNSNVA